MTDNEIIKAMQCVIGNDASCSECAYQKALPFPSCRKMCAKNAFYLINRQKAEIERLKLEIEEANEADREAAVQVLKESKENAKLFCEAINYAKSEAIKEFAEELEYFVLNEDIEIVEPKCKDYESYIKGANQFRHQIKNGINSLVKERTEVNENEGL